ncbi:MAG: leucine-rich repeat domain-containing protein [Alistipes sp.]|nr:leucine-rich repeat domain-containing protein [Alistipes sp.]
MLRKLFTFILCLMATIATVSAQTPPNNEIWYTTTNGKKLDVYFSNMVSNSYNNGRGVLKFQNCITSIGDYAFENCSSLKSITIPNSVKSIGSSAFAGCSSLTSITIPNSVTSIEWNAFGGCSSLTSINIPDSVTSIESGAFWDCCSLTSITIPESVTIIGDEIFKGCSSLKSITIPNSVIYIGEDAFAGCSSLKSITIGNSVTHIGEDAFAGCSSLKSVKVANKYCYDYFKDDISNISFFDANVSADGRCLIVDGVLKAFKAEGITEYTIPDNVTSIGGSAFYNCDKLTSITIPNSVVSIGEEAFAYCGSLTSINIPNSVTEIGEDAFKWCNNLKSITIPNSVTEIGDDAFANCNNLTSVKVSNRVCYLYFIDKVSNISFFGANVSADGRCLIVDGVLEAFKAEGITEYTIPESVTIIGEYAFYGCSSLKSITISESVTSIGEIAFYGCSSLTSITIPNSVTSIGEDAFYGCSSLPVIDNIRYADTYLVEAVDKSLTSYSIKTGTRFIESYAFYGCRSLTSITIPNSVTSIDSDAFHGCSSLTSITIPNSVTSIGRSAFWGCGSLKSVKVANKYCYDYFKNLDVYDITFMVSTLEEYQEAQEVGATKLAIDSNSKYASKDGLCLIDNGKLIHFIGKDLTEYTIPESVTSIRKGAFNGCSGLKSVKVSNKYCYDYFKDKVTNIAFYGANATADGRCLIVNGELQRFIGKGIAQYSIPNGVTSIGDYAFENCSHLTNITIPESVTSIGYQAFKYCSSLTSITCLATTPPTISILSIAETTRIYVPKEAVKLYKKDLYWSRYKKQIKAIK